MFFIDRVYLPFSVLPGQQAAADSQAARCVAAVETSDPVAAAVDSDEIERPVEMVV